LNKIKIYDREKSDGLADSIGSNQSVSFCSQVEPFNSGVEHRGRFSQGSIEDDDLYFVKAILVSSNWNGNDDVFDRAEILKAKDTPIHKQTNLNHNPNHITGHIVDSWIVDADKPLIHLAVSSVIYKMFKLPELVERSEKLIQDIEQGKMFVSMEVLFSDFDYALHSTDGTNTIVERHESTSGLTKHLKRYGGSGSYRNNRIGRVLRNLNFSGKGYTKTPANEHSIIFT